MVIQYRVSSLVNTLFSVSGLGVYERRGPSLVHDASEAVLRQVIGRHDIDEALTEGKLRIQTDIREKLQILFDRYDCGLTVESVQLQTVGPPSQVDDAFKDVASAKEDRERLVNEARGYQNDVIPKARGEAEKLIKEAERTDSWIRKKKKKTKSNMPQIGSDKHPFDENTGKILAPDRGPKEDSILKDGKWVPVLEAKHGKLIKGFPKLTKRGWK